MSLARVHAAAFSVAPVIALRLVAAALAAAGGWHSGGEISNPEAAVMAPADGPFFPGRWS